MTDKLFLYKAKNSAEIVKLLIVENNIQIRKMIKEMFNSSFASVYECDDGICALEKYKELRPDWVFMDILMDKMDGIQATKDIIRSFPDAKVIMVTDFNDEGIKKLSIEAGASEFVLKENLYELFEIINNTKQV